VWVWGNQRNGHATALLLTKSFKIRVAGKTLFFHMACREVIPHQDSSFLYTEPPSVIGLWLAIEDANQQNGCLFTLPGSHLAGVHRRFVRQPDDSVSFEGSMPEFNKERFLPLEVKAGSLVLLHGANVHFSNVNRSMHSRHAYSMHIIEGDKGHTWASNNWLQRDPLLPFQPLYDSGNT
jgi:phytanoyl-CoA hydroxylase